MILGATLLATSGIAFGGYKLYSEQKRVRAVEAAKKYADEHRELYASAVTQYEPSTYSQYYAVFAKRLNREIKNLRVVANKAEGLIQISFDYPSGVWYAPFMTDNILIRLYDKNGNELVSFKTAESYAPTDFLDFYAKANAVYLQMGHTTAKIYPKDNLLSYPVSLKDLEYAQYAEVGFNSGVFGLTFGIRGKGGKFTAVK